MALRNRFISGKGKIRFSEEMSKWLRRKGKRLMAKLCRPIKMRMRSFLRIMIKKDRPICLAITKCLLYCLLIRIRSSSRGHNLANSPILARVTIKVILKSLWSFLPPQHFRCNIYKVTYREGIIILMVKIIVSLWEMLFRTGLEVCSL